MARRNREGSSLPSFFQDNPWLDILAQRGVEPSPDFTASEMPSAPTVNRAKPAIESEPITSSPATPPAISLPRELVVRLEVPSEFIEAIRELKEAIIMALSVGQRQATIIPIYVPISVAQTAPQTSYRVPSYVTTARIPTRALNEALCPKCGKSGKLYRYRKGGRIYILILHGRRRCYLGPEDVVKVKWPSLAEKCMANDVQGGQDGILSPSITFLSGPRKPLVGGSNPPGAPLLAKRSSLWWLSSLVTFAQPQRRLLFTFISPPLSA